MSEHDQATRLTRIQMRASEVWGDDGQAEDFLSRPHMLLDGRRPADVARDSDVGAQLVEAILGRLQHGSAA